MSRQRTRRLSAPADSWQPHALRAGATILCILHSIACTVPVAHGLDEPEANRVAVALQQAGISAEKHADPQTEGRFLVEVSQRDTAAALRTLQVEALPRPKPPGVLEAVGQGALVPSRSAEHAHYVRGLAGDLETSLLQLDGVHSARIHLQLPLPEPLRLQPTEPASASVLISHRDAAPPLSNDAVAQLVAGGVRGLRAENVAVVQIAREKPQDPAHGRWQRLGPLTVSESSLRPLQWILAALLLLVLLQAAIMLLLLYKLSRSRQAASVAQQL